MNCRTCWNSTRPLLAVAFLALLAVSPCLADPPAAVKKLAEAPTTPQKLVAIEGITEYRLDNGLRVLLFPDPSAANVTVNLTVFVGSRHEGYGETGMAHLLEHMVFKGTPRHPDVPKALKEHGAQFNGTTWVDRTNYFETMPGTDENLEFGIRLEADRMVNSFIRREDLVSEMTVVRNEFERGENEPGNILSQRMGAVAYEWHNYGKTTIGNRSDIERVPIDRLQAFYRKYYQPDNAMLVVAGQFNEDKALGTVVKYFGALKKPERMLETTYTEEPAQDGERSVVLRRVGKVGVVGVLYHVPAGAHEDFPAVEVLNNILASEPSGRLYKALVESKKATNIQGGAYSWHDPGIIEFQSEVDPQKPLEPVRDTLIDQLENFTKEKPTAEEVERAKRQLLKDRELLMTKSNRIGIVLSDWGAKGDWRLFFLHRDRLEKVTPADVERVAARYLQPTNRTVGLYIPSVKSARTEIPETPRVADLVKGYKGRDSVAAGEVFDPTPANIEGRVERSQLPSGVQVALLPKKTRGQSVVARLTLRFGNEHSLNGHTSAAQLLAPLMLRGSQKHGRQEIQDELDKLGARLNADSGTGTLTFTVEAKRDKLPAVLQLLGEILRAPAFAAKEFDILKAELKQPLEKNLTEPMALAVQDVQRRLRPYPPDNIRYVPTIEEAIARLDAVTLEEVRQLYEQQVGGQVGELAVVGDFDKEAVTKLVQDALASWKAKVPYERIARPALLDVKGARSNILTPDKANAFFVAGHMLGLTDTDPDYPALDLASYLFGEGALSSRLGNRVRQKEGLSYGVGSQFNAESKDKSAVFSMYAICNPSNMEKLDQTIAEELAKLLKDGVTQDELDEAKKSYVEQLKVSRANDSGLAAVLAGGLFLGRTFDYQADLEKKIAGLTTDIVNQAVRKHWQPEKLVIIRAGDFKKMTR